MFRKFFILLALLLSGSTGVFAEQPASWAIDTETSRLSFTATYDEIPFQGSFHHYQGEIIFDPNQLEASSFHIAIDLASVDTESRDRDEALRLPEWFDVQRNPQATFDSTSFKKQNDSTYIVTGSLSIKGISIEIQIPFVWNKTSSMIQLSGEARVDRRDFEIGSGDWLQDDTIGFEVNIEFDLRLTRP